MDRDVPNVNVGIIMGSVSDRPIMREAMEVLLALKISFDTTVASSHRNPDKVREYAQNASSRYNVIIAAAGGAAGLPGMVKAYTPLHVIGVPLSSKLKGLDSLASMAQMPMGVSVSYVGVDGAVNAALAAAAIIGGFDKELRCRLEEFSRKLRDLDKVNLEQILKIL